MLHTGFDEFLLMVVAVPVLGVISKFSSRSLTVLLQAAKGGSHANTTGKASSSGELKFCGEDGKKSDIFDV